MKFTAGRIFLLPIDFHLFTQQNKEKNFTMVEDQIKDGKYPVNQGPTLIIETVRDRVGNLLGGKIGKKSTINLPKEEGGHLTKKQDSIAPYVHFIWDGNEQIIAIQKDVNTFNPISLFQYLAEIINHGLYQYGFHVKINPLVQENYFWDSLKEYNYIFEAEFRVART